MPLPLRGEPCTDHLITEALGIHTELCEGTAAGHVRSEVASKWQEVLRKRVDMFGRLKLHLPDISLPGNSYLQILIDSHLKQPSDCVLLLACLGLSSNQISETPVPSNLAPVFDNRQSNMNYAADKTRP